MWCEGAGAEVVNGYNGGWLFRRRLAKKWSVFGVGDSYSGCFLVYFWFLICFSILALFSFFLWNYVSLGGLWEVCADEGKLISADRRGMVI